MGVRKKLTKYNDHLRKWADAGIPETDWELGFDAALRAVISDLNRMLEEGKKK